MKIRKIIQINTTSHSLMTKDYDNDKYKNWYARLAVNIKKYYPTLKIECWSPEKEYKEEKIEGKNGIVFREFPSNIALRHGMDISFALVDALKKEIKISEDKKEKLIIHFHEYHSWQTYVILSKIEKSGYTKIIAQHHGGRPPIKTLFKYKKLFWAAPVLIGMQFFENLLLKRIDIFYSLSDEETAYLKKVAPNSKVKFLTMGISEEYFKKGNKIKARKKLGMDLKKKYFLFIGRMCDAKGLPELLSAIKGMKIELILIGGGDEIERYKKYIKENKIDNARFVGVLYGKEKIEYLTACDYLILPSRTEGAPVVVMEALAKNLPVIATDVGGVRKMIKDNVNGIIIPPYSSSAIKKAIEQILKWNKKNVKKYAKVYKWKRIIKETVKDYLT